MKAKLLKKIRKRFDYYFNKDGEPVLVDLDKREVSVINIDFYRNWAGFKSVDDAIASITIDDQKEVLWRLLKDTMLKPFGYKYGNLRFNYAKRKATHARHSRKIHNS